MQLTLGNLLDERELGLTLVTSDPSARERPVRGAHAIEVAAPTRWIPDDWVMLTNGLRLRGRPDDQRRLIAELDDGGQAALGWAVGVVLQRVPQAIVDEAERRGFPVFLVPIETAFHQIISFLHDARTSEDMVVMRRIMSMEDYLMDALHERQPERAIVARLASVLDVDAVVATSAGEVLEASGRAPAAAELRALVGTADEGLPATLGGRPATLLPIPGEHADDRLLIASGRRADPGDPLGRAVLRRAAQLLGLVGQGAPTAASTIAPAAATCSDRRCAAPARRTRRRSTPRRRRSASTSPAPPTSSPGRCRPGASETAALGLVRELLEGAGLAHLLTLDGGRPVALVRADPTRLAELLATPQPGRPRPCAGVGRRIASLRDARRSHHDARLALAQARSTGAPAGAVIRFDQLDAVSQLLATAADADDDALAQLASVLAPLREQPHLLATLRAWIDCRQNATETAARLHLHRNSLRYRLARVEELLGVVLESPRGLANIQLALLADELGGGRDDAAA